MKNLLLLHGATGDEKQLIPLKEKLDDHYQVYTLNFSGHGGKPFPLGDFSIPLFAEEVKTFLKSNNINEINIFGYSMGGYVAMYLASQYHPGIQKIATLATKFSWDEATATKETAMLQPEKIETKVPVFAATLANRHQPNDWKEVMRRTANMLHLLGQDAPLKSDNFSEIRIKSLLLLGDRDKMVSFDETLAVYKLLPEAALGVLPNSQHPIEQINIDTLAFLLKQFFE